MHKLLVANIKADLKSRIGGTDQRQEVELTVPSIVVEDGDYIQELLLMYLRLLIAYLFKKT